MRLVVTQPPWVRGCADAVWWRRVSQPHLPAWAAAGRPLRLVEQPVAKQTKRHGADPKALAGYGLLARWHPPDAPRQERVWLRFVDGRPLSGVTTRFRAWGCAKLAAAGKTALLRVWDHASWHISREVQAWIRAHNRQVRATRHGVRSVVCPLPTTRPWLHPIEPMWVQGKRAVVEPARLLTAQELADRVCAYFTCAHEEHLTMTEQVA